MIQLPALILCLVLATTLAVGFHLWKGKGLRDLLFLWLAAVVGFASGQLVGQRLDLIDVTIGQVHVIEGTLVCLLFLVVARWIMQEKTP